MVVKVDRCLYADKECYLFGDCDICPIYQNRNTLERNFMKQLNSRKEWTKFFDNSKSEYYMVRWIGLKDGKQHEEPVFFKKIGDTYQEMVPTINLDCTVVESVMPVNPLPDKIIIVKELSTEDVHYLLRSTVEQ